MNLRIKPFTAEAARALLAWRYTGDYSIYNIEVDDAERDAEIAYLTDPANHYFGIYQDDAFVGHAVYHHEARVPGGDYSADALDVGAGMRPDWTGQGKGTAIIRAVLDFGHTQYAPSHFRATIAAWNARAQKATTNNGFREVSRFTAEKSGKSFIIFMRKAK